MSSTTLRVKTDELLITFVQDGPSDGWPVVLSHGFRMTCTHLTKWFQLWPSVVPG
jgi:hypothetical protein